MSRFNLFKWYRLYHCTKAKYIISYWNNLCAYIFQRETHIWLPYCIFSGITSSVMELFDESYDLVLKGTL